MSASVRSSPDQAFVERHQAPKSLSWFDTPSCYDPLRFILDEPRRSQSKGPGGCDRVHNVDAYQEQDRADQRATQEQFDAAIANLAHSRGFAVGLKNDLGRPATCTAVLDFAITSSRWQ